MDFFLTERSVIVGIRVDFWGYLRNRNSKNVDSSSTIQSHFLKNLIS